MNRRSLLLTLACVFMWLLTSAQPVRTTNPLAIPNPKKMTVASIRFGETVDPHWAYDDASLELIRNVYNTLIFFDWDKTSDGQYYIHEEDWSASTSVGLAANWSAAVTPEPGYAQKVVFEIRSDVKWQDYGETYSGPYAGLDTSDYLTPADVEYSFERWMFLDRSGGPTWMIFEALFGPGTYHTYHLTDPQTDIDAAVESNATCVWFNFKTAFSLPIFYQVIAQPWASIIDKDWAVAHGCWDGVYANWLTYNDPPISPLDDPEPEMMGSGPFKGPDPYCSGTWGYVDYLSETWTIRRFADYWEGWPAPGCSDYLDEVTMITEYDFAQRKLLLLSDSPAAQADMIYIPRGNIYDPDILSEIAYGKVRFIKGLPGLELSAAFFNFDMPDNSPYCGDFQWGTGIPKNFFADFFVRRAFAHSFDWTRYINMVHLGEATQPATPLLLGLGFDTVYGAQNPSLQYAFSTGMATADLKLAHGGWWPGAAVAGTATAGTTTTLVDPGHPGGYAGDYVHFTSGPNSGLFRYITVSNPGSMTFEPALPNPVTGGATYTIMSPPNPGALWTNGFKFTIPYPKGNIPARDAALILETNIEDQNWLRLGLPPFQIDVLEVPWPTLLRDMVNYPYFRSKMPLFITDWRVDYPDPHSPFFNLFHTYGHFTYFQSYFNPTVDAQIELEITQTRAARMTTLIGLMTMFSDPTTGPKTAGSIELPSLPLVQPLGRHYERTWVQGWYYNPVERGFCYKRLWKGLDADVNADGTRSVGDGAVLSAHWHMYLGPGLPYYDGLLGYNRKADIDPVTPPPPYGEGDGLAYPVDGYVDMKDVGLLQRCMRGGSHIPP